VVALRRRRSGRQREQDERRESQAEGLHGQILPRPAGRANIGGMNGGPVLVEVRRAPERRALRLSWSDGHAADFDWDLLRGWCPCAVCQGHSVVKMTFHAPVVPVAPVQIAPVGNYGISIAW